MKEEEEKEARSEEKTNRKNARQRAFARATMTIWRLFPRGDNMWLGKTVAKLLQRFKVPLALPLRPRRSHPTGDRRIVSLLIPTLYATQPIELRLLRCQLRDRRTPSHQPFKVGRNVARAHVVPIRNLLASFVLANAQASNRAAQAAVLPHLVSQCRMWSTRAQTPSARLARVMLQCDGHHKPMCKSPHQPHANA